MPVSLHQRSHGDRPPSASGSDGFTLVELLVAAAMGVLVLTGAVIIVVSHIRAGARLASLQHLQDHCGWVQFLINREIEQAQSAVLAPDNGQLQLSVPGYDDLIIYAHDGVTRQLWRTGPSIDARGRLEEPASRRRDLVARDVERFTVDVRNPRFPRYVLTMRDAMGSSYTIAQDRGDGSRAGGAYCRAREITGPSSGAGP